MTGLTRKEPSPWAPAKVDARIFILHLGKIDSSTCEVEIMFMLQLIYHDPFLNEVEHPELVTRTDWDRPEWLSVTPSILNEKEMTVLQVQCVVYPADKKILREYKCSGVLQCDMDLRAFPFGFQELNIFIESEALPAYALQFTALPREFMLARRLYSHPEFIMLRAESSDCHVGYEFEVDGPDPDQYLWSRYTVTISVARRAGHYTSKLGSVFAICLFVALAAHAYPVESLSDRLGLVTTMLLTTIAFQFVVADTLPKIAYWTTFDKLVIATYVFFSWVVLESVVLYLIKTQFDPEADVDTANAVSFIISLLMGLSLVGTTLVVQWRQGREIKNRSTPVADLNYPAVPPGVKRLVYA